MLKLSFAVAYVRLVCCFHKYKKLSLLMHVLLSTFFCKFLVVTLESLVQKMFQNPYSLTKNVPRNMFSMQFSYEAVKHCLSMTSL